MVVEPASLGELAAALAFAREKEIKVAVASGLRPVEVRDLGDQMLVLTTHLAGPPIISTSRMRVRADAGLPAEALSLDLQRAGMRWHPLLPVPAAKSVGELIASGWEGLRNWRDGSPLSHVDAVEWMTSDGERMRSEFPRGPAATPDVSGFLFGSRGRYGVITALELIVEPQPQHRTAALFELPDAASAVALMAELRECDPQPETVIYWGEVSTQILREGNDGRVGERAAVLLAVEWSAEFRWPEKWAALATSVSDETALAAFWQDIFRFPRTAARLYPERLEATLRLPAETVVEFEEAAREFGRDFNYPVALWGTLEAGHLTVWVLEPDNQPRTGRRAEELLKKLIEAALALGGCCAAGALLPAEIEAPLTTVRNPLLLSLREEFRKKCDAAGVFVPLQKA